jgi:ketosteroid isomerase-like protein
MSAAVRSASLRSMIEIDDVRHSVIQDAVEALASGEPARLCGVLLDPDIHWHEPGRSLVAGDYRGCEEVAGSLFGRLRELSGGTFRVVDWDTVTREPEREVAMYLVRARRGARDLLSRDVCYAEVRDGAIIAAQVFHADQHAWDRFWS